MDSFRVGLLIAVRQIQRSGFWTTSLIIFVMMLTFLNLIAVSGILVGLITGAERAVEEKSLGDVIFTPLEDESTILETQNVLKTFSTIDSIANYSARYRGSAVLEANFSDRTSDKDRDDVTIAITGIDVAREDALTNLSEDVVAGAYLDPSEYGQILVGAYYLEEYASDFGDAFDSVSGVKAGSQVLITINGTTHPFTVKGIVQSKVDEVSLNTFIPEKEFRRLFGTTDNNATSISLKAKPGTTADTLKAYLLAAGLEKNAKIQTFAESLPKFLIDIKKTFNILGTFIGSIGVVVASITIFIIIFIIALSRRRQIGILKGIGISPGAIQISYVLQSGFYSLIGSCIGALITYGFLIPYFEVNPIQFPFSEGVLVADPTGTFIRFCILFIVTLLAGFLPAWMITRQNTLNAILGRK